MSGWAPKWRNGRPIDPQPDLVRESALREQTAVQIPWYGHGATDRWPDPYGPDPIVFGAVPRVKQVRD